MRIIFTTALTFLASAGLLVAQGSEYWPSREWKTSTPQAQGMDAAMLSTLDAEFAQGKHGYVDGMLVVRNGYIVFEKSYKHDYEALFRGKDPKRGPYNYYDPYWHPYYRKTNLHTLQSVSKSVTSALIGIAMMRGELAGTTDLKILKYFEDFRISKADPRKDAITLRDLLTMRAGIQWDENSVSYTDLKNSCARMEQSRNWVQFVLDQPMATDPGRVFVYNSGATELLAEILMKATGKQADEYAAEHLFKPLGITQFYWKRTPTGLPDAEGGLYLTLQDLAKIGYLYLKKGAWDNRGIIQVEWIKVSTSPAVDASPELKYGFHWWVLPYQGGAQSYAYAARGYGGQALIVVPEYNLISVFTGWNIYDVPALSSNLALARVLQAVRR